jgi:hypothetical protein
VIIFWAWDCPRLCGVLSCLESWLLVVGSRGTGVAFRRGKRIAESVSSICATIRVVVEVCSHFGGELRT